MDYLYGLVQNVVGDEQQVRLIFLLAVALSAMLAVGTLSVLVMGLQDPVRRRVAVIKRGGLCGGRREEQHRILRLLVLQILGRIGPDRLGESHRRISLCQQDASPFPVQLWDRAPAWFQVNQARCV